MAAAAAASPPTPDMMALPYLTKRARIQRFRKPPWGSKARSVILRRPKGREDAQRARCVRAFRYGAGNAKGLPFSTT
jgi:hypothetical protein